MNDATWGIRAIDETGVTSYAEEPGTLKLRAPIKFIWNYGSNVMMGQHADINDSLRIYNLPDEKDSGVRMIVTVDPWMTPTAMASDIILPGTTPFEEDDLATGGTAWTGFICCESKAIEPHLRDLHPSGRRARHQGRVHRGQDPARLDRVVLQRGEGGRRRLARHLRGVPRRRPHQAD